MIHISSFYNYYCDIIRLEVTNMDYKIRKQEREDCKDVVHIKTIAWNETYKGIVPDEYLANLYRNEDERLVRAYEKFEDESIHQFVLIVDNKVVGFLGVGKSLEEEYPNIGQIYALYIINKYHGYGFGRKLVETGIKELKKIGFDKMIICCLEGNPTNEFYKHIGGNLVKTKPYKKFNIPENIYYYENI